MDVDLSSGKQSLMAQGTHLLRRRRQAKLDGVHDGVGIGVVPASALGYLRVYLRASRSEGRRHVPEDSEENLFSPYLLFFMYPINLRNLGSSVLEKRRGYPVVTEVPDINAP